MVSACGRPGNADAQYNLGWMYANGRGARRDDEEAARWYRRVADQGDALRKLVVGGRSPRRLCDAGPWRRSVGTGPRRTYRQLLSETPATEPQRHSPWSTTGGPGRRAAGEAMPFPRQRSVVGLWAGAQVGRLDPSGTVMRKLVVLAKAWWTGPPLVARTVRARRRGSVAGSVPFAGACGRVHSPTSTCAMVGSGSVVATPLDATPAVATGRGASGRRQGRGSRRWVCCPSQPGLRSTGGVTCRGLAVGSPVLLGPAGAGVGDALQFRSGERGRRDAAG